MMKLRKITQCVYKSLTTGDVFTCLDIYIRLIKCNYKLKKKHYLKHNALVEDYAVDLNYTKFFKVGL